VEDGGLQIMYGIDGRRDLTESTRDDLSGYAGARPVRIGNGAFDQRQNDVYGAALDSILLHTRRSERLPRRLWPIVQAQAACATAVWRDPDQGIWEARGAPQHYVSSKLMCWVALDRAAKLGEIRGDAELRATWAATAEEIRADILEHGVDGRGVLRQHYATDALDASTLLAALFGFLPGDDPRLRATVMAIGKIHEYGYRRISVTVNEEYNRRVGGNLLSGFYYAQKLLAVKPALPPLLTFLKSRTAEELSRQKDALAVWLRKQKPDALLISDIEVPGMMRDLGYRIPQDIAVAGTTVLDIPEVDAGIDQHAEAIGRTAVETLLKQMNVHEHGEPRYPSRILVEGRWQDGKSLPPRRQA